MCGFKSKASLLWEWLEWQIWPPRSLKLPRYIFLKFCNCVLRLWGLVLVAFFTLITNLPAQTHNSAQKNNGKKIHIFLRLSQQCTREMLLIRNLHQMAWMSSGHLWCQNERACVFPSFLKKASLMGLCGRNYSWKWLQEKRIWYVFSLLCLWRFPKMRITTVQLPVK